MKKIIKPIKEQLDTIVSGKALDAFVRHNTKAFIAYRTKEHVAVLYRIDQTNSTLSPHRYGFIYLTSPHMGAKFIGEGSYMAVDKALKQGVDLMLCDSLEECLTIPYTETI